MDRVRVGMGDRVRVSKCVLGTDYHGEGTVTKFLWDSIGEPYFQLTDDDGHVDYWSPLNDLMNSCEVLQRAPVKAAMAASLVCFCVNALISSLFKMAQGFIDPTVAVPACIGTLVGANIGAVLNRNMPTRTLKLIFGLVFCYVAIKFIGSFFEIRI